MKNRILRVLKGTLTGLQHQSDNPNGGISESNGTFAGTFGFSLTAFTGHPAILLRRMVEALRIHLKQQLKINASFQTAQGIHCKAV